MMIQKKKAELKKGIGIFGERLAGKIKESRSIADIGCGQGELLKLLHFDYRKKKENLVGFEENERLAKSVEKQVAEIRIGDFNKMKLSSKKFDLVFLLDVLEHQGDPVGFMKKTVGLMKKGGWLVISTPNIGSFSHFVLRDGWYGYKDKTHKVFYKKRSLVDLVESVGLDLFCLKTISASGLSFYNRLMTGLEWGAQIWLIAVKKS